MTCYSRGRGKKTSYFGVYSGELVAIKKLKMGAELRKPWDGLVLLKV